MKVLEKMAIILYPALSGLDYSFCLTWFLCSHHVHQLWKIDPLAPRINHARHGAHHDPQGLPISIHSPQRCILWCYFTIFNYAFCRLRVGKAFKSLSRVSQRIDSSRSLSKRHVLQHVLHCQRRHCSSSHRL